MCRQAQLPMMPKQWRSQQLLRRRLPSPQLLAMMLLMVMLAFFCSQLLQT